MVNKLLYSIFRTPPNVRAAKTLIATVVSLALGAVAQSLIEGGWEIPVLVTTFLPPVILWLEKRVQAWGADAQG